MTLKIHKSLVLLLLLLLNSVFFLESSYSFEGEHFTLSGKRIDLEIFPDRLLVITEKESSKKVHEGIELLGINKSCITIQKENFNINVYETSSFHPDIVIKSLESIKGVIYAGYVYSAAGQELIIDNTFICKFEDNMNADEITDFIRDSNLEIVKKFDFTNNCYILKITDWKKQHFRFMQFL